MKLFLTTAISYVFLLSSSLFSQTEYLDCLDADDNIISQVFYSSTIIEESCVGAFDGKIIFSITQNPSQYSLLWDNGETSDTIKYLSPRLYSLVVSKGNQCSSEITFQVRDAINICEEIVPHVYIPTAFSPNHDGENDILFIRGSGISSVELSIFNKLGEKIFNTTSIDEGWNGMFKNKLVQSDVYTYFINAVFVNQKEIRKYGTINVVR